MENQTFQPAVLQTQATHTTTKKGEAEYEVAGELVKLSYNTVRTYLTKGNAAVTDQEIGMFISICRYNKLNPFLNEAYLIKFGSNPAQMIVSKEALMKRAEANGCYDGLEAGLILLRNGELIEVEGNFYLPSDQILGAWAKVYRKDRSKPFVAKVNLNEYDKKQSSWNEKKATMIAKVAKVQALREAFPVQLGAMYTQEEQGVVEPQGRTVIDVEVIDQNEPTEPEAVQPITQPVAGAPSPKQVDFKQV